MRAKILPVLSGALLLSACGAHTVGDDLPACDSNQELADFKLPQPLTGIEVRAVYTGFEGGSPTARTIGESCSSASCETDRARLDAQQQGWSNRPSGSPAFVEYVIGFNQDRVVGSATSDTELVQLLGPIDTVAEATLVAELKGLWCVRAGETGGSLQVVSNELLEDCAPIVRQEVLYRVDPDASVHELSRGDKQIESNSCIGRRPAGLLRRTPTPPRSRIGDFLARSAELEAASVVAFQVLESELRAHGAPTQLLDRVAEAADDEVIHARLMRHLAERLGGRPSERSVRLSRVRALETIAVENSVEGCVAETWGCLIGMHQAEHASRPLLRRVYRRIARDEARHAQLSWDIADWAETKLDAAARDRVAQRRAEAVHELASHLSHESQPGSVRKALGLPDADTRRRLFEHVNHALWS